MTMRIYLGVIITAVILLFSAACSPKPEINRELISLPLNAVVRAEIEIEINNSILIINNGTHNLLDGEFFYSATDQRPVVIHHQDGDIAQIAIRQPPGNSVFSRSQNEWKLYLSNDIPIHLTLKHGSGIHTLSLGGLWLSGLEVISSGAGILLLDLAGFWEEDLDILVRGSQGTALTITAPQGTGTRIETEAHIRKIDQRNFLREQDAFINTAYKGDGAKLNVKLQDNFGNLSLESGFRNDMPVHVALGLAQTMFSKEEVFDCSSEPQDRQPLPTDTVRELWFDYLCHRGPQHRILDGSDILTQDLAASELVDRIRRQFYAGEPLDEATLYFNIPEFLSATVDMATVIQSRQQYEFSITHFIGSFDYSVSREGDRVRYEIHNQTDRSSGTHIPLRFPKGGYTLSLEELVREEPMLANAFLLEVIHSGKYPIISILEAKSRADTAADEGGGNFTQTFTWTERDLGITELPPWPTYLNEIDIK